MCVFLTELGRKGDSELSIAMTEYQHPKGGRIPRGLIVSEPLGHGPLSMPLFLCWVMWWKRPAHLIAPRKQRETEKGLR